MARNSLMPQMQLYDAPQAPNVAALTNPLMQGLQTYRQGMQQQFEGDRALVAERRQGEQLQLAKNQDARASADSAEARRERMFKTFGNMNLAVVNEPDEAKARRMFETIRRVTPDFDKEVGGQGLDLTDYRSVSRVLAARAGVLPDPLERRRLQAEVSGAEGRLGMLPLQRQSAELDLQMKQREFNTPKVGSADLGPGHSRVFYDPRTGQETGRLSSGNDPALGPFKDMKQRADVEESLRKEVTAAAKEYNTIRDASTSLEAISKAPSAAKDIAMVFSFMKILDPNSVVRETEYATAAKAAGLDDRFVGYITKIQNGQFLTSEQRQDFLGTAKSLAQSREQGYKQNLERYRGISTRTGVDPRNVLPDEPQSAPQTQGPPKVAPGQSYSYGGKNWRFKGGNAADPNSWEPLQ